MKKVRALAAEKGGEVIVICGELEAQIGQLVPEERHEFLDHMGVKESGLEALVHAAYKLLDLETFFTAGPKEARAWTIHRGATAPQAAGKIHSDFERGFIRAETIAYDDYVACGASRAHAALAKCGAKAKTMSYRMGM